MDSSCKSASKQSCMLESKESKLQRRREEKESIELWKRTQKGNSG